MRARPLESVPCVAALAHETSRRFCGARWNVGVDVVCYRDGKDSCGWHSDDTQGETLVVKQRLSFRLRKAKPSREKDLGGFVEREEEKGVLSTP